VRERAREREREHLTNVTLALVQVPMKLSANNMSLSSEDVVGLKLPTYMILTDFSFCNCNCFRFDCE